MTANTDPPAPTAENEDLPGATPHDTMMWEVRAAPARSDDLIAWVDGTAVPELLARGDCLRVDVFGAADDRVVVIARFANRAGRLPDPPADLLRRPPHSWTFQHRSSHRPAEA
jgi:hypothetical protein